jgi:DNA-binding winged helix-turn-helix (wHTH) protein
VTLMQMSYRSPTGWTMEDLPPPATHGCSACGVEVRVPSANEPGGSGREILFGPFQLHLGERMLRRADRPLRLGSRAREILVALVERAGEIVTKSELMQRVWPNIIVEEGTLRVHIAALRKTLEDGRSGARYVENVTGQGYRFVAPITRRDRMSHLIGKDPLRARLPGPLMLDWSEEMLSSAEQIALRRLAVFAGMFDLPSAVAVVADEQIDAADVFGLIASLAAKCLLTAQVAPAGRVRYRLSDASRAFALERLQRSPESSKIKRRHAQLG